IRLEALAEAGFRRVGLEGNLFHPDDGFSYASPMLGGRVGADFRLLPHELRFAPLVGLWAYGRADLTAAHEVRYHTTSCFLFSQSCTTEEQIGTAGGNFEAGLLVTVGFDARLGRSR